MTNREFAGTRRSLVELGRENVVVVCQGEVMVGRDAGDFDAAVADPPSPAVLAVCWCKPGCEKYQDQRTTILGHQHRRREEFPQHSPTLIQSGWASKNVLTKYMRAAKATRLNSCFPCAIHVHKNQTAGMAKKGTTQTKGQASPPPSAQHVRLGKCIQKITEQHVRQESSKQTVKILKQYRHWQVTGW